MTDFALMTLYNGSIVTLSILVFVLGIIAVKSARSGTARAAIITFTLLIYTALFVGPVQLLSYAKPTRLEWLNRDVPDAEVLHAELREGDAIYLLLDWYGRPRYYKIEWDPILAEQLINAMDQAREQAGGGSRPGGLAPGQGQPGFGSEGQCICKGQEGEQEGAQGEQGLLDQLLGPQGEGQSGQGFEQGEEGQEGPSQGQGQGQGEGQGEEGQGQGQAGQGMMNGGNGKVFMRFPFREGEFEDEGEGEGQGPGAEYGDTQTEAMFYAAPQPAYPEKTVPED